MIGLTRDKLNKFNYLSEPEVKDIWWRVENKLFLPLRNALNCIGGFVADQPIYNPYPHDKDSHAMHVLLSVDEFNISPSMKILTRALDNRYGGSQDWDCKIQHTDQRPFFIIWLDTGKGSKSKSLNQIVEESDRIAENIMRTIDDKSLINMFESSWEKLSDDSYWGYDYGHCNTEMFEIIKKAQDRKIKLTQLGV